MHQVETPEYRKSEPVWTAVGRWLAERRRIRAAARARTERELAALCRLAAAEEVPPVLVAKRR